MNVLVVSRNLGRQSTTARNIMFESYGSKEAMKHNFASITSAITLGIGTGYPCENLECPLLEAFFSFFWSSTLSLQLYFAASVGERGPNVSTGRSKRKVDLRWP